MLLNCASPERQEIADSVRPLQPDGQQPQPAVPHRVGGRRPGHVEQLGRAACVRLFSPPAADGMQTARLSTTPMAPSAPATGPSASARSPSSTPSRSAAARRSRSRARPSDPPRPSPHPIARRIQPCLCYIVPHDCLPSTLLTSRSRSTRIIAFSFLSSHVRAHFQSICPFCSNAEPCIAVRKIYTREGEQRAQRLSRPASRR